MTQMDPRNTTNGQKTFRVDIGHSSVTVRCHSAEEAIPAARRQLSIEAPRMWDLIQNLEENRFRVSQMPDG